MIAIDRDEKMLEKGKELLSKHHKYIEFVRDTYSNIDGILAKEIIQKADYILLDLGVNMEHFKDPERGFSFLHDAPLDMRFDQSSGQTAAMVVNTYSREKLAKMFTTYGDFAPTSGLYMADALIEKRSEGHILTTHELNDTLRKK
ncbi:16S rRNA (cytosine(1402)-N(4))-methyltransferase [Patescibacteria group bacterium]|nr:16S rRNA (cytosine(1402)-N(4))-methyltransferase [Patescibacteria group bacterium]